MKRLFVVLASLLLLVTASCAGASSGSPTASEAPSPPSGDVSTTPPAESVSPETSEAGGIEVDNNLLTVEITLPASMFKDTDMSTFDPDAYAKEQGFIDAKVNEDGSVTVKMTKAKHAELLAEMKASFEENFAKMAGDEATPYIQKITHSDDFSKIVVDVDRAGYEKAVLDMTPFTLGLAGMMYQAFIDMEKHVEVIIRDGATGETIKAVSYPDALKSQG